MFGKFTVPTCHGDLSIRAQFYGVTGGSASYIPRDLVQAGLLSPKAAIDNSDGYRNEFQNITVNYALGDLDEALTFTGFLNHDTPIRFANFGGGQTATSEDRTTLGFTARKVWTGSLMTLPAQLLIGTNFRSDSVRARRQPTLFRNVNGPPSLLMDYTEIEAGEFVQAQLKPVPWLKFTGGGRYDHIWYHVSDRLAATSVPPADTGVWSPKVGVALSPTPWLEVYANYGQSFRSLRAIDELLTSPNPSPPSCTARRWGYRSSMVRGISWPMSGPPSLIERSFNRLPHCRWLILDTPVVRGMTSKAAMRLNRTGRARHPSL